MTSAEKKVGNLERRLRHWGAKLDELAAKGDDINAEAKADYHRRIEEFRAMHQVANSRLAEFRTAGIEKWEQLGAEMEHQWAGLASAFRELKHPSKPSSP